MNNNKQSSVEKDFAPYEEALALKEIGFNEHCHRGWDEDNTIWYHPDNSIVVDNPTFSQAFRWFREKYDLDYYIYRNDDDLINYVKNKGVVDLFKYRCGYSDSTSHPIKGCYTHEEAELACLRKLIEIVKEKNNEQQ